MHDPNSAWISNMTRVRFGALLLWLMVTASAAGDETLACSPEFGTYARDTSARTRSVDEIYARTRTKVTLTEEQEALRRSVISMYRDAGVDVSLDIEHGWGSQVLLAKMPKTWSTNTPTPLAGEFSQPYSVDAAWNLRIPRGHPRIALPRSYFNSLQLTSPDSAAHPGGDGIGMGIVVAKRDDPVRTIVRAWINQPAQEEIALRISDDAERYASRNRHSDRHLILIDPEDLSCICTMKIRFPGDPLGITVIGTETFGGAGLRTGYYARALATAKKHRLDGIGAEGVTGTVAAGFPQLGLLIRAGEVTNASAPIRHALGGPSGPLMKARAYPASSWDSFIDTCEANFGALPYGALVQLDPAVDLRALLEAGKVSFPAYRILEALQNYGWYMVDSSDGGSGKGVRMGIYASNPASEYKSVRPPSVDSSGVFAVSKELEKFITGDPFFGVSPRFYVVAPLVKMVTHE
jgi:hypothetical protein